MKDNSSNHRNPKEKDFVIDKRYCCQKCGKTAKHYSYSKYFLPPKLQVPWMYVCDDCPTLFILKDLNNGKYHRNDLPDSSFDEAEILPF